MPSCTIYNRSAFFQLHHNNAAWWRSEWFGDSTIGLLNVFAKKLSESKIKSTKHWTSRRWAWPKIFIGLLFDYSKNILLLTTTRSYFSISILLSKTFGHFVNLLLYQRVVEKLINLKLMYWSFQMWLLIIWGTNWTQGFHWFKCGWLITHHDGKNASKGLILLQIAILFGQLTNLVASPSVWLFVVTARWC